MCRKACPEEQLHGSIADELGRLHRRVEGQYGLPGVRSSEGEEIGGRRGSQPVPGEGVDQDAGSASAVGGGGEERA